MDQERKGDSVVYVFGISYMSSAFFLIVPSISSPPHTDIGSFEKKIQKGIVECGLLF